MDNRNLPRLWFWLSSLFQPPCFCESQTTMIDPLQGAMIVADEWQTLQAGGKLASLLLRGSGSAAVHAPQSTTLRKCAHPDTQNRRAEV